MLDYFISWCVQCALDARNSLVDARNHRLPSIISNNGKFQGRPFFFWLPSSNSAFIHTPHMFSRHRNKLHTFRHTCWWESMSVQRFRKKKNLNSDELTNNWKSICSYSRTNRHVLCLALTRTVGLNVNRLRMCYQLDRRMKSLFFLRSEHDFLNASYDCAVTTEVIAHRVITNSRVKRVQNLNNILHANMIIIKCCIRLFHHKHHLALFPKLPTQKKMAGIAAIRLFDLALRFSGYILSQHKKTTTKNGVAAADNVATFVHFLEEIVKCRHLALSTLALIFLGLFVFFHFRFSCFAYSVDIINICIFALFIYYFHSSPLITYL